VNKKVPITTLGTTFKDCVILYGMSGNDSPEEEQSLAEGLRRATCILDCKEFAREARSDAHRVRIYRHAQTLVENVNEPLWIYCDIIGDVISSPQKELLALALESLRDAIERAKRECETQAQLHALLHIAGTIRVKPHGYGDQYLHEVLTLALALAPAPEVAADTTAS
jgi:hypothetical protein